MFASCFAGPHTYLAHHELKSKCIVIIVVVTYRLIWTATEAVDMVDDSIDDCIPEWPCDLTNNLCMENLWLFEYVPLPL